jgi:type III secretory pathway component EscV
MDASSKFSGSIEVVVGLHPSLERFVSSSHDASDFLARLGRRLGALLEDLRLPAAVELRAQLCQESDRFPIDRTLYQVSVAGSPCRLELKTRKAEPMSAAQLSRDVANDIYCNRDLILTPALSETIRERWLSEKSGSCFRSMPVEEFHDLLLTLVRRGSRVDRAKELDQGADAKSWDAGRKFEAIIASPSATAVRVLLSRTQSEGLLQTDAASQSSANSRTFQEMLDELNDALFYDLGIFLPAIIVGVDESLAETEFRIQLNDLRLEPWDGLGQDQFLVDTRVAQEFMITRLGKELRTNAWRLLTTEVVECVLDLLEEASPDLVRAARERFDVRTLASVMRDLLREDISIRNLRALLESLLSIRDSEPFGGASYSEWVRADFKRYISHKYLRGQNTLIVSLLAPQIEERVAESAQKPLTGDERRRLLKPLLRAVEESFANAAAPVILTSQEVKRKLRPLVERELPSVVILAYQELSPDMNIQPVGRIEFDSDPAC